LGCQNLLDAKALKAQNQAGLQRSLPAPSQYPSPMWQQPLAVAGQ
jgi:hypothetical protein